MNLTKFLLLLFVSHSALASEYDDLKKYLNEVKGRPFVCSISNHGFTSGSKQTLISATEIEGYPSLQLVVKFEFLEFAQKYTFVVHRGSNFKNSGPGEIYYRVSYVRAATGEFSESILKLSVNKLDVPDPSQRYYRLSVTQNSGFTGSYDANKVEVDCTSMPNH